MLPDSQASGLYQRHRPTKLSEVVGQESAVAAIKALFAGDTFPRAIGLYGPSGTGKTTLARIMVRKLGCEEGDYFENNAANDRGIDTIRDIARRVHLRSIRGSGGKRVWLIDEAHQLTSHAGEAMLKMLEDAPPHVHFFLATTNPGKLLPTVRNRLTPIEVKPVKAAVLKQLVLCVAGKERRTVPDEVAEKIADCAEGSPRRAVVLLEKVLHMAGEAEMLAGIDKEEESKTGFQLARLITADRPNWHDIAEVLRNLEEDPENVRRGVLGFAQTMLIGKKDSPKLNPRNFDKAGLILSVFKYDLFTSGKPGLTAACWEVLKRSK